MECHPIIPDGHRVRRPLPPDLILVRLGDGPVKRIQQRIPDPLLDVDDLLSEVLIDVQRFPFCDGVRPDDRMLLCSVPQQSPHKGQFNSQWSRSDPAADSHLPSAPSPPAPARYVSPRASPEMPSIWATALNCQQSP